ncbi:MAG: hypothetical protein ACYTCU_00075 [Planctomycetota bacterium]
MSRHSAFRTGLLALVVAFLAAPVARPQGEGDPAADLRIGTIHSSPQEIWVDVPADLSRTWSLTLGTLIDFQYAVNPELSYLESNGQIRLGGLWVVVVPQPSAGMDVTRVLIGAGDGAVELADDLNVIAGAILGVIADRVEGRAVPGVPLSPYAYQGGDQPVVNNYYDYGDTYYDYGSDYVPYVSPWATSYSTSYWGVYWWPTQSYYGWGSPWCSWYKPYYSLCYTPWWGWKGSWAWSSYCYAGGWSFGIGGYAPWAWNCDPWWAGSAWYGGYGSYVYIDNYYEHYYEDDDDWGGPPDNGNNGGGGDNGIGTFVGVDPRAGDLDVVPISPLPHKGYDPIDNAGRNAPGLRDPSVARVGDDPVLGGGNGRGVTGTTGNGGRGTTTGGGRDVGGGTGPGIGSGGGPGIGSGRDTGSSSGGGTRGTLPPIVVSGTDDRSIPRAGPRTIVVTTSRPSISTARSPGRSPTVVAMPTVSFQPSLSRVTTYSGSGGSYDTGASRGVTTFAPTSTSRSNGGLFAPTSSSSNRGGSYGTSSRTTSTPTVSTPRVSTPRAPTYSTPTRTSYPTPSVRTSSPTPTRSTPSVSRPSPTPTRSTPPTTRSSPKPSSRSSASPSRSSSSRSSSSGRTSSKSRSTPKGPRPR